MPISEDAYDQAVGRLVSATWLLYQDLAIHVVQLPAAAHDLGHPAAEVLSQYLPQAWQEVRGSRDDMISAIRHLRGSVIEDHGLYGPELGLKIGLWLEAREQVRAALEGGDSFPHGAEAVPKDIRLEGEPLPARKQRERGKIKRFLNRISKALGHADNWLNSLIAALGQNERLKEIKETLERGAGDIADEIEAGNKPH